MPSRFLLLPLNHLLSRADWARSRLQAHAGQFCRISGPLLPPLQLCVDADGYFTLGGETGDTTDTVHIDLPADLVPRLLRDGPAAGLAAAHLSGPAAFAETLGFVFRNLRWDLADDLSPWIGDVAAQRIASTAGNVLVAKQATWQRLTGNIAEFFGEESNPYLPLRCDVRSHQQDLDGLAQDIRSLEQRLLRLEQ